MYVYCKNAYQKYKFLLKTFNKRNIILKNVLDLMGSPTSSKFSQTSFIRWRFSTHLIDLLSTSSLLTATTCFHLMDWPSNTYWFHSTHLLLLFINRNWFYYIFNLLFCFNNIKFFQYFSIIILFLNCCYLKVYWLKNVFIKFDLSKKI